MRKTARFRYLAAGSRLDARLRREAPLALDKRARGGMTGQGQSLLRRSREDGKPNDKRLRHLGRLFDESSHYLVGFLSSVVPAKTGTYTDCELRKSLVLSDILDLPHEGRANSDPVCEGFVRCQKGRLDDTTIVDVIQELNFDRCQGKDALQQWKSSLPERRHICHCPVVQGTTT